MREANKPKLMAKARNIVLFMRISVFHFLPRCQIFETSKVTKQGFTSAMIVTGNISLFWLDFWRDRVLPRAEVEWT
jgi:hypothetical protein